MATLVDAVAEIFTFEALNGTTSAFDQGASDRYIYGSAAWAGFSPPPTISALKYGGSTGTDITPGGSDVMFFFGNAAGNAGSATPGPTGTSTIYAAASAGLQGGATGLAYEGVASSDDYTATSGVTGDINELVIQLAVPNCVENQEVVGTFYAVSANVSIAAFTDEEDSTEIIAQDLDPGVTFMAVCVVRRLAPSTGTCMLTVRAHSTSAPGTDAISWAAFGERLIAAEGGGPDPLTAETGTFTLTGGAAGLRAQRLLTAQAGAYALTGNAATLAAARRVAALAGAFALAGGAAGLLASRRMVGDAGAFAFTGNPAGLLRALRVTGQAGSFTLTGNDAALRRNLRLTADVGSFAFTGNDATLSAVSVYILTAEAGAYSLTGNNAGLRANRRLTSDAGSFTLTGVAAGLRAGRRLAAEAGAFALTGNDATLTYNEQTVTTMPADTGAFVWSGNEAGLRKNSRTQSEAGVFALTGGEANFYRARHMTADAGSFAFNGGAAQLRAARHLLAQAGAFVLVGNDMHFNTGGIIDPSGERTVLIAEEGRFVLLAAEDRTVQYSADNRVALISQ